MGETHASGAAPGEGATRFTHTGYRYVLGYGADFFGIWDRERPDEPVLRYSRSDEGWDEAWNRFIDLEPGHVEVPKDGIPQDAPAGAASFIPIRGLGRWTAALIGVSMFVALASAALWTTHLSILNRVQQGAALPTEVTTSEERVETADALFVLSVLPTATLWCVWQYRAHKNLRGLGATRLGFSPGWAVGYWFIPLVNFVLPYLAMRELWKASEPNAGGFEWKLHKTTWLLPLWWVGRLAAQFSTQVGGVVGEDLSSLLTEARWSIAAGPIIAVWGILAIVIVERIGARQERDHERMMT